MARSSPPRNFALTGRVDLPLIGAAAQVRLTRHDALNEYIRHVASALFA
ncbi:hypothetical protein [Cryobacterium sp. TMT2-15-1]